MLQVEFTVSAQDDLRHIFYYTKTKWGNAKAIVLKDQIRLTAELLALFPDSGRKTNKNNVLVKVVPRLPFLIVYKMEEKNVVLIIQILHQKQQL